MPIGLYVKSEPGMGGQDVKLIHGKKPRPIVFTFEPAVSEAGQKNISGEINKPFSPLHLIPNGQLIDFSIRPLEPQTIVPSIAEVQGIDVEGELTSWSPTSMINLTLSLVEAQRLKEQG